MQIEKNKPIAEAHLDMARNFFQADYYLSQVQDPEAIGDPLDHYLRIGWLSGLDPNVCFSTRFYLKSKPDLGESGVHPFIHFLEHGKHERSGCLPFYEIPLNNLVDSDAYAAWCSRWRYYRSMMTHLKPTSSSFAMFTVVLLEGTGAAASLASLMAQDYANIEVRLLGTHNTPESQNDFCAFRGLMIDDCSGFADYVKRDTGQLGWRGDFIFFLKSGSTLDTDFFSQVNALLCAMHERNGEVPALITADFDRIDTSGICREPTFLHGWDPDWQLATDAETGNILFGSDLLIDTLRTSPSFTVGDLVYAYASRPDWLTTAHLAGPLLHLPASTCLTAEPRLAAECTNADETLSIIIPNKDRPELLDACCRFLAEPQSRKIELIIVDNASSDPALMLLYEHLQKAYNAKIIAMNTSFNYSRMINVGVAASSGDLLLFLNNDVVIPDQATLSKLCAAAARPEVGLVGSLLTYPDGSLQHAGMLFSTLPDGQLSETGHAYRFAPTQYIRPSDPWNAPRNWQSVTGAVQCCRRKVYDEVGGYDEIDLPIEYNDVDFSLRVRQLRYRVLCLPLRGLVHDESATRRYIEKSFAERASRAAHSLMQRRWPEAFARDPFANPFLNIVERWPPCVRDFQTQLPSLKSQRVIHSI